MDASWPHNLSLMGNLNLEKDLKEIYNDYKTNSINNFGRVIALKPHLLSEKIYNLAKDPTILEILKPLMGGDINIWSSAFFAKEANTENYVGYHQDAPYWQLSSENVYSAWIAITNSCKENGCLEFIDCENKETFELDVNNPYKSYREGEKTTNKKDLISFKQKLPKSINNRPPHYVELKPGQFSIHNIKVVHGSSPNRSNMPRIGFVIRYVDSDTYHLKDKADSALNIEGAYSNYFDREKRPHGEFSEFNINEYQLRSNTAGTFGNKQY